MKVRKSYISIVSGLTKMVIDLKAHNEQQNSIVVANDEKIKALNLDNTTRLIEVLKAEKASEKISALVE